MAVLMPSLMMQDIKFNILLTGDDMEIKDLSQYV